MDQALANALKRRKQLEDEIERLDQFIDMYHELAGASPQAPGRSATLSPEMRDAEILPTDQDSVNRLQSLIRPRGRPDDFAQIMAKVLREVGRPLQRGDLVEEVEKRGHLIPSKDKPRYLGTILWRQDETFISVEGRGYWLKDTPLPPAEGDAMNADPDLLDGEHTKPRI